AREVALERSRGRNLGHRHGRLDRFAGAFQRKGDASRGAAAELAGQLEPTAMELGQPLHHRQSKPGAVIATVVGIVRLYEWIAELRQVSLGDTDAVIGDGKLDNI